MKRFLLFFLIFFCSHLSGGEITYRYIGDSTGIPYQYELTLSLYRDSSGISLPASSQICVSSSCFGSRSLNLPRVSQGGGPYGGTKLANPCRISAGAQKITVYKLDYQATVILDGKCSDWSFTYNICCRSGNIDNLFSPNASSFAVVAVLDNTRGENNSGKFTSNGLKQACINLPNRQVNWDLSKSNPDGDSLFYQFDYNPVNECFSSATSRSQLALGYSTVNPVSSNGGVILSSNGLLRFEPYKVERAVVRVGVEEWRRDTVTNFMVRVGYSLREAYLLVSSTCVKDSISPQFIEVGSVALSTQAKPVVNCNEQSLTLDFNKKFTVSSVTRTGSEFRLTNSLNQSIPIIKASTTDSSITLDLHSKLWYNDTLLLELKTGTDGNTILNPCGSDLPPFSAQLTVNSCTTSVGDLEISMPSFSLYPNPADDLITIQAPLASAGKYSISNLQGAVIRQGDFTNQEFKVNISELSDGVYLFQIEQDENLSVQKFAKN